MSFIPPTHCPECASELEWQKDQLYCRNSECPAQQSKQVEHFAKTLKIKGLGPSTIARLELTSISDIYTSDLSKVSSDKIREKLGLEINRSLSKSLNEVLPALGIPLIGKSATGKLAQVCDSIFDINEETCRQAGLGPKSTDNLLDWLATNLDWLLELPFSYMFEKPKAVTDVQGVICISGRLKSFPTKAKATEALEAQGWKVVSSVTKEVTHLVNESGKPTAKTQKAEASGIIIVTNIQDIL